MIKKIIQRAVTSFMASVTISLIISLIIMLILKNDTIPVVPDYASHFSSKQIAFVVQLLLMGIIGAVFAGSSVVFEIERWSFLLQGVIHLVITTAVWVPISAFCWVPYKYHQALINIIISFLGTYCIIWLIQYMYYRKSVKQINAKIMQLNQK